MYKKYEIIYFCCVLLGVTPEIVVIKVPEELRKEKYETGGNKAQYTYISKPNYFPHATSCIPCAQ